jgi:hypothetical protein
MIKLEMNVMQTVKAASCYFSRDLQFWQFGDYFLNVWGTLEAHHILEI